jgi:hypothetical protein
MDGPTKYTLDQALEAAHKGITKAGAARVLGCARSTIVHYCKRWKTLEEAFQDKQEELVDLAEMALRGAVLKSEPWSIAFTLRTLGRKRGYIERQEHEHSGPGGGAIPITFVEVARAKPDAAESEADE